MSYSQLQVVYSGFLELFRWKHQPTVDKIDTMREGRVKQNSNVVAEQLNNELNSDSSVKLHKAEGSCRFSWSFSAGSSLRTISVTLFSNCHLIRCYKKWYYSRSKLYHKNQTLLFRKGPLEGRLFCLGVYLHVSGIFSMTTVVSE